MAKCGFGGREAQSPTPSGRGGGRARDAAAARYAALGDILGTGLVDTVNQAIRSELFEDSNRADLVQALMQAYPEMATSRQAVASEAAAPPEDDDDTDTTAAGAK
jgi:hypothetical protein